MPAAAPTTQRYASLDVVRGVAVLGIFTMNVVAFAMITDAYSAPVGYCDDQVWNKAIFALNYWIADQKFMGMFSILFGAGIVLLSARLERSGRHVARVYYSRNVWLLVFGVIHFLFLFEGDVLVSYALCAFVLFFVRHWPSPALLTAGLVVFWGASLATIATETVADPELTEALVDVLYIVDGIGRAAGMMLIGMVLFRTGLLTDTCRSMVLRRTATLCLGIGLPIVGVAVLFNALTGWQSPEAELLAAAANSLATPAISTGYIALIVIWVNYGSLLKLQRRLAAVGQMALTNYLLESVIGAALFAGWGLGLAGSMTRAELLLVVAVVWLVLLVISPWWLSRFRYGPMEWLWRSLTYLRRQPFRRQKAAASASDRPAS